jgi:hypothetical protein
VSITHDGLGSPCPPADGQATMARANAAQQQRPLQKMKDITVRPAEGNAPAAPPQPASAPPRQPVGNPKGAVSPLATRRTVKRSRTR